MRRSTPFSARTPGKLLVIWRTSSMGPALLCPAFVLVDIFFGDQVYRYQSKLLLGLLAVKNVIAYVNGFTRHGEGILCGAGRDQTIFVFERRHNIGRSIDSHYKEIFALRLFGRQVASYRRWIVDGKHRIELLEGCQQVAHDPQAPVATAPGILVLGQDLDSRVFFDFLQKT